MDRDPYRILGVPTDATEEQIRQTYRDLARVWHPDRFLSDRRLQEIAQERLREINEAYSALKRAKGRNGEEQPFRRQNNVHQYREVNYERQAEAFRRAPAWRMPFSVARMARSAVGLLGGGRILAKL